MFSSYLTGGSPLHLPLLVIQSLKLLHLVLEQFRCLLSRGLFFTHLPFQFWRVLLISLFISADLSHLLSAITCFFKPPRISLSSPDFSTCDAFPPRYLLTYDEAKLIFLLILYLIWGFSQPPQREFPLHYPTHVLNYTFLLIYLLNNVIICLLSHSHFRRTNLFLKQYKTYLTRFYILSRLPLLLCTAKKVF